MKKIEPQLARALEWVASLPLLGDRELAGLVGVDERDARHLREELGRRGWVEWVTPRSDGVHARPLSLVRDGALPPLADWLGVDPGELRAAWPVGRNASLERICRLEVVQGVNRLLAMLAAREECADLCIRKQQGLSRGYQILLIDAWVVEAGLKSRKHGRR